MKMTPILDQWNELRSELENWAVQNSSPLLRYDFEFSSYPPNMKCLVSITNSDAYKSMSLKERAESYLVLATRPQEKIRQAVDGLDSLSPLFGQDSKIEVVILHHYGMGSTVDCSIVGADVDWSVDQHR